MSYARWSDGSAVYVFADVNGGVTCCGCLLSEEADGFGASPSFYDVESLIAHFREHTNAGHEVPEDLFDPETYRPSDFDHR